MDFAADGRIFITERAGRIRIVEAGQLRSEPWMTLDVATVGESGLLGLALDPKFSENRFVYVAYSYRTGIFGCAQSPRAAARGSAKPPKAFWIRSCWTTSPGQQPRRRPGKFGPGGTLLDHRRCAKNRIGATTHVIEREDFRLNPDGGIPPDNPFPNSYVYSYGHRNSQGLALAAEERPTLCH